MYWSPTHKKKIKKKEQFYILFLPHSATSGWGDVMDWLREIKWSWILQPIAFETKTSSFDFLVQSFPPPPLSHTISEALF